MKNHSSLSEETRHEVRQMLNHILADEFGLYTATRDCRAIVTGPDARSLRRQLEIQCGLIGEWIDQLVERARALATGTDTTWTGLAQATRASVDAATGLSAEHVIWELLSLHEEIVAELRTAREACADRHQDADTADFLTGLMEQHQEIASLLHAEFATEGHHAWAAQSQHFQSL